MAVMSGALMTISSSTVSGVLMAIIKLKATNPFNNAYRSVKEIICKRVTTVWAFTMTGVVGRLWLYDWNAFGPLRR